MNKGFWVISYDIPNDKRRRQVCRIMEGHGRRAQYSVFECELTPERRDRLEKLLLRVIDDVEDDVRFYPLNRADLQRVVLLGRAVIRREPDHYIVSEDDAHPF